ncbi:hypothetical protein HMPREF9056_02123 [Actinomyces sp. oral taxon 170 str. F0386]|nr:hypothetical protein HMPREF9056_02123 [Actinomyces sp. oral taxon 170 str. F0386]
MKSLAREGDRAARRPPPEPRPGLPPAPGPVGLLSVWADDLVTI